MKRQFNRILSLILLIAMLSSFVASAVYAESPATTGISDVLLSEASGQSTDASLLSTSKTPADESPYKSVASIGDSIAAGYGPLMQDNTWTNFYYEIPPVGSYPYELTEDLGLDPETDFNSLLCIDQRILDVYYALGGEPEPVVDHTDTDETVDYLEDARDYHGTAYMDVLEGLHNSGEGAERIENSDLITIQIGLADLAVYPLKRSRTSSGYNYTKIIELMEAGILSYQKYYPKLIKLIKEINPDAKILLVSQFNPYEQFEFEGDSDQTLYNLFNSAINVLNLQLKGWCGLYNCSYVDITDLADYIDNDTLTVESGEFVTMLIGHENHPGTAGHRYIENQILDVLNLELPSETPSADSDVSYLAFTSDVHNTDGAEAATRLDNWIDNVSDELGDITFDAMGFCGDVGSAFSGNAYGNKVQIVMDTVTNNGNVKKGIYTTGNHEYSPGKYATDSAYEPYSSYIRLGEAADTDRYQIYCFGAAQYNQQFNQDDIDALAAYMAQADSDEPVFILSHFPIHSNASRSSANASKVIEVLNNYPNAIFLWGHNHTDSDPHYGIVYTGDLDGTPINFIYCSAGCMSDSEYSSGSANTTAKGLVASIDGDEDLVLTYYDKEYNPLNSYIVNIFEGTAEEQDIGGEELEPNFDENVYSSASSLAEGEYVIAVGNMAMNATRHEGYVTLNYSNTYSYPGLAGGKVRIKSGKLTAGLTEDQVWIAKKVTNGYTLQNKNTGKYLTGHYYTDAGADIQLEDEPGTYGVWVYTSDKQLKNYATGKYLNFEVEGDIDGEKQSGETNLFTLRSGADDIISLYSATASSDETVVSDYAAVSAFQDGSWYLITAENYALLSTSHDGYVTLNGSTYKYSGLTGKSITVSGNYVTGTVTKDMLWQAVKTDDGFALKNRDGKYLASSYSTTESGYAGVGKLYLSDTPETWELNGTALLGSVSGKYLNYQNSDDVDGTKQSGSMEFFTIRSSSKDDVKVYLSANGDGEVRNKDEVIDSEFNPVATETVPGYDLVTSSTLTNGAKVVFAFGNFTMSDTPDDGYKVQNTTGNYHYSGLSASPLGATAGTSLTTLPIRNDYTVWTVEVVDGGYRFKNSEGKYLSASYTKNVVADYNYTAVGTVTLLDTPDASCVWTYTNNSGTVNLTNNSGKYLTYNNSGNVSGTPFSPADSKDISVFTVRSNPQTVYLYQESTVKYSLKSSGDLKDGATVVFAYNGFYMGSSRGTGYKNKNEGLYYQYTGLSANALGATAGTSLTVLPDVTSAMTWTVEKVEGGYRFKNSNGKYLSASYKTGDLDITEGGEDLTVDATGLGKLTLLATPNDSSVWTVSISSSVATVTNNACGKILTYNSGSDVTGTLLEPSDAADVSLFTVRSSRTHSLYIYQETKNSIPQVESGKQYIILNSEGYALSTKEGTGYNDVNSDYRYEGLTPVAMELDNGELVSTVTNDLVWTVTASGSGYTLQNADGQYLNSVYDSSTKINVYFSDNPEVWTYRDGYFVSATSGKYLTRQTNGGTASVFTLRSGEADAQPFSFYAVTPTGTKTALYVATVGGSVSRAEEVFAAGQEANFSGSTATARTGYNFVGWYKNDILLTEEASYTPTGTGVYEARFAEKTATISYIAKLSGEGDTSALSLSKTEEKLGVISGSAEGSVANEVAGYTFLYWTSDAAGKKIIGKSETYIPKKTNDQYADANYYAWYTKKNICFAEETETLSGMHTGTHYLYINGTDCGKFVFTEVDGGYSIYSTEKNKFLAVNSNKELYYSSVYDTWSYDDNAFSTKASVKVVFFTAKRTFYLDLSDGVMVASTSAPSSLELVDKKTVGYTAHADSTFNHITESEHSVVCSRCGATVKAEAHSFIYTNNGNGTHTASCATCGYSARKNCTYESGTCTACGGSESEICKVSNVKVSIETQKVYKNIIARILKRYTTQYNVTISAEIQDATIQSISYSTTEKGEYTSASSFTSTSEVNELWIKIVDSDQTETLWHYSNGETTRVV